ncbi:hypothetical protein OS493_012891 [Desmophyllum pertusum]|uniref:Uncharacterized protein n=1 Tax=Desmophyllum pertusum TaxID=174260 RepID=A0A9W9Z1L9_9CNID|nr:hypothetical protein OS493_012891 [Desmophyllum pertusum]
MSSLTRIQDWLPSYGAQRGFSPSDTMMAVYDWVGSQTPDPEYFELHSNSVKCLPASMSVVEVDRQTLYMAECDVPPLSVMKLIIKQLNSEDSVNYLTAVQPP